MADDGTIDITPDKSLMRKLGMTGYRSEQAVAELVDNSIDAAVPGSPVDVRVTVDHARGMVVVSDDGSGMDRRGLADAMTVAREAKEGGKLGVYGMGMKSACSALGRLMQVTTSKAGSRAEYEVEYDEERWMSDSSAGWSNLGIKKRALGKEDDWHGTRVTVRHPRVSLYPNLVPRFRRSFGVRYAPYLRSGRATISVNGVQCRAADPDTVDGSRRDVSIRLQEGRSISGHVALLKRRSVKGLYGIHLFKNGRLIRPFEKFGFSAHPENSRIVGELNLDHVPVSFDKRGFITESPEYREAEGAFRKDAAARHVMRASKSRAREQPDPGSVFGYFGGRSPPGKLYVGVRDKEARRLLEGAGAYKVRAGGRSVTVSFADLGGDDLYSVDGGRGGPRVTINRSSRAFGYVRNPLFLVGLVAAEAATVLGDPGSRGRAGERNALLSRFLSEWRPEGDDPGMRHGGGVVPNTANYHLDRDLVEMHDFLEENYGHKFQFTALSTLSKYLHNLLGRITYTVYTVPGMGEHLKEFLSDRFGGQFVMLVNPGRKELEAAWGVSGLHRAVVIREYAEIPGTTVAAPEKALVDLANEILTHGIHVSELEIKRILESLVVWDIVDKEKLFRYAKHMKKMQAISQMVGVI